MNRGRWAACAAVFVTLTGVAATTVSAGASGLRLPGGRYEEALQRDNFGVILFVAGTGHSLVAGPTGTLVSCTAGPSFIALDPGELSSISIITISLPHALPIAASGAFSYSGNVTLSEAQTHTSQTFVEPIALSGHFTRGTIVAGKTVAVTGTFSAPSICEPGTPTSFRGIWKYR